MKKVFVLGLVCVLCFAGAEFARSEQMARQPSEFKAAPARERGDAAARVRDAAPAVRPNLKVLSLSLNRTEVFAGEEVIVTAGVACEGGAVNDPVRVRFLMGGRSLGDEMVTLRQGKAGRVDFKLTAGVVGSHKLIAHVNPDGKIVELNLRDNQRGVDLTVKQRETMQKGVFPPRTGAMGTAAVQRVVESARGADPLTDLVVMDLRVDKPAPAAGEEVTATARIQNIGSRDLDAVTARLFLDGRPVGRTMKTDVGAGRVAEVETAFEAESAGAHEVKVQVDPDNRIPELDDQRNNVKTLLLAVSPPRVIGDKSGGAPLGLKGRAVPEGLKAMAPRPVLLIRSLSPSKAQASLGEQLRVEAEIGNQSEEDLGPVRVAFFLGERQIGSEQQLSIPKGGTQTVVTQFRAEPVGGHLLKVNAFPPAGGRYEKTAPLQVTPPMAALSKGEMASGAAIGAADAVRVAADLPGKPQGPEVSPDQLSPRLTVPALSGSMESDTTPDEITIISPSGGSAWKIGAPMSIQWKHVPAPKPFHLWLLSYPQAVTAEAVIAQFKTYTPNGQGVFSETWSIPSWVAPGDYYLKIVFVDDPSVSALSGPFKIEAGGPVVIAPGVLYAGPPVEGFEVFRPGQGDMPERNSPQVIGWNYTPAVLKDPKLYEAVGDKVRILLNNDKGVEQLTIAPSTGNSHPLYASGGPIPNSGSSFPWLVPDTLPDGNYRVRVETPDGRFYGESVPFKLSTPPPMDQMKVQDKSILQAIGSGDAEKNLEKLIDHNEPLQVEPVQLKAKILSVTPHFKNNVAWKIDVLVEIDASSQFQFGDYRTAEPKMKPFVVSPSIIVQFRMFPADSNWTPAMDPANGPPFALRCDGEVIDEYGKYNSEFIWPTGVLNKGKNIVKFQYSKGLNEPYCAPLELRWDKDWDKKTIISCVAQLDAAIGVEMFFQTMNQGSTSTPKFWITLKQPRTYYYDHDSNHNLPCKTP